MTPKTRHRKGRCDDSKAMAFGWGLLSLAMLLTGCGEGCFTGEEPKEEQGCETGSLVEAGTNFFADISDESGIRLNNYNETPPEGMTINDHSRLAFSDINGDGFDDMVMHSLYPNAQNGVPFEHLVFLNNTDGTFQDFSEASGLRDIQAGFFAFGDIDNDGDQDVFAGLDIPNHGSSTNLILLNDGNGVFTILPNSGVEPAQTIAANALFLDADGDANLDLFVGNGGTSAAVSDLFYLGSGDGHFTLAADRLPSVQQQPSNGSISCDYDNDGDLDIFVSTYSVSTAYGHNHLWENDGQGFFTEVGLLKGFAALAGGNPWLGTTDNGRAAETTDASSYVGSNGFGLDCADIDGDGNLDIFLTTISHPVDSDYFRKWSDASQILINGGEAADYVFTDRARDLALPFNEGDIDGAIIDFDNDGRLDLSLSRESKYEGNISYTSMEQKGWFGLMRQIDDGTFESVGINSGINVTDVAIAASLTVCTDDGDCTVEGESCLRDKCRHPCSTRSDCEAEGEICHSGGFCRLLKPVSKAQDHAWSDIDHDGDLDLLIGGRDMGGGRPNFLFRNEVGHKNRWMAISLEGDGQTINRDAIGSRVTVTANGQNMIREKKSSRGMYNSEDTRWMHFGLGGACDYELHIRWSDGKEVEVTDLDLTDSFVRIVYPDQVEKL